MTSFRRSLMLAGLVLAGWLGITGTASAASLVRVLPEDYSGSGASYVTAPPYDSRVFISTRGDWRGDAQILLLKNGELAADPFLGLDNVSDGGERGLLSFAFDPDYAVNGRFYVLYTANGPDPLDPAGQEGDIRIVEYRVSDSDPDRADPDSARLVLKVPHSADIHNGGWTGFGPDGLLYITIGENGNPDNSQDPGTLLGKILRINPGDPPGPAAYSIPDDNPFAGAGPGTRPEIWATGVRNPFRASFHPDGRLIVADVGQSGSEEVNIGDLKGANLGWPVCEGTGCDGPPPADYSAPFFTYPTHDDGHCAIIGGYVVRDPGLGSLLGRYLFGDFCSDRLESIAFTSPGGDLRATGISVPNAPYAVRSFGEDSRGCLYLVTGETVYRIAGDIETGTCPIAPPRATYRFTLKPRQALRRRIPVTLRCSLSCTVDLSGIVRARGRVAAKTSRARWRVGPGQSKTVRLDIPARRMGLLRRTLRARGRVSLTVKVVAVGDDGSKAKQTLHARLTHHGR